MPKMSTYFALIFTFLSFNVKSQELNTGPWRFELKTEHATIPFIIELHWNKKRLIGKIFNGKEVIVLNEIIVAGKKIKIPLQMYESSLLLTIEKPGYLVGHHVRHNKKPEILTPITGTHGMKERFPGVKSPAEIDLGGRWKMSLRDEHNQESLGIGLFEQKGDYFTGSILTPTGDYRYLEGFVSGRIFEAASFDGVFNYLIKGKITKNGKMTAELLSGSKTIISGEKNAGVILPDAYAQTQVSALDFKFPDLKGHAVTLNDKKFKNKPVIIQFFGSWCPNCIDEMNYLIPWYKNNAGKGIEIVALSFERSLTEIDAKRQLIKVQKKKQVPYTMLLAGATPNDKPMDKIPGLKNFLSFPTMVFLNKKHIVIKVHTGFTGPGTGEFFEKWKMEFEQTVKDLLK